MTTKTTCRIMAWLRATIAASFQTAEVAEALPASGGIGARQRQRKLAFSAFFLGGAMNKSSLAHASRGARAAHRVSGST